VALEQSQLDDNGINHPVNAQDAVTVPPGICDDVKSIAGVCWRVPKWWLGARPASIQLPAFVLRFALCDEVGVLWANLLLLPCPWSLLTARHWLPLQLPSLPFPAGPALLPR
jgi:hypothetical protein